MVEQVYRDMQSIAQWLKTLVKVHLYLPFMSHITLAMLFNLSEIYFSHLKQPTSLTRF